jgi:hypothetical protein
MPGSIFELCEPRRDVVEGRLDDASLAADLAQVLAGKAPPIYGQPSLFFANTYPTRGLRELLRAVSARLSGRDEEIGAVFRLHTHFGGGKTHGLIALVHAVRGMEGVTEASDFLDPSLLPGEPVRVAAFDGENADPTNGRRLEPDLLAFTPWGELAWALRGREGYERVRESDRQRVAPGAETLAELLAPGPALVLIDELAVYLRKAEALPQGAKAAAAQLAAFLTALVKAVESTPRTAAVLTLAVGREGKAADAYREEHEALAQELASILARKATILNPTEEEETVAILRRRLFERVDLDRARPIVERYAALWRSHAAHLPELVNRGEAVEEFLATWPFHPDLVAVLREKLATQGKFQRVRGMLRLLARTVHRLWLTRPADADAIHTHHVDLGFEPIRQELTTRIERTDTVPLLVADVAAGPGDRPALAQQLDERHFRGLTPYASYVARTIFLHSLAYPPDAAGIDAARLRWSLLAPELGFDFIEQARKTFVYDSAYLDDRPGVPYRFRTEPNLTLMIRREAESVDPGALRDQLNARIREIFDGRNLELVPFPGGPFDVPDDVQDKRPRLVLVGHEAAAVDPHRLAVPELVLRIFRFRGQGQDFRHHRNHLLFLVAEEGEVARMQEQMRRRLALEALKSPASLQRLPEYQQKKVEELARAAEADVAAAIQKAYRHLFYPSLARVEGCEEPLAHTALEHTTAAAKPGDGQRMIVERLRELGKLRLPEDEPDSPAYVRDRTPLKKGSITTAGLRAEFFRDPSLPMLVGDEVFIKLVRRGVEQGDFVYRAGSLLWAEDLPPPGKILIDEQTELFTAAKARELGIWPRPEPPPPPPVGPAPDETTSPSGAVTPRPPPPPPPPAPDVDEVTQEGVLKEALTRLFDKARSRGWQALSRLVLRPFEPNDAFTLSGLVELVPNARKTHRFEAEYEGKAGGSCRLEFEGNGEEAKPVREFLKAQLAAAADSRLDCHLELVFEQGLSLAGEAPIQLIERLARAGAGAAQVRASAERRP